MRIAIDFDGTITQHPKMFRELMHSLVKDHYVIILTAAAGELPPEKRYDEVASRIARLDIPYSKLVCCESHEKAEWCKRNEVSVIIDDSIEIINSTAPYILRLHVAR